MKFKGHVSRGVDAVNKGVEDAIKKQIDKGAREETVSGNKDPRFTSAAPDDNVPERDATVTKVSSVETYLQVGDAVRDILEKRAGKKDKDKEGSQAAMHAGLRKALGKKV